MRFAKRDEAHGGKRFIALPSNLRYILRAIDPMDLFLSDERNETFLKRFPDCAADNL